MKIRRTPQDKKRLSYDRDGRSDYGENDKASRKAIPFRKRWVNKTYRKAVKQTIIKNITLLHDQPELLDAEIKEVKRKPWKKSADKRLGDYLRDKAAFKEKYLSVTNGRA